ncbi:MAG: ATP-binding protein [Oscillospiraceae bacterium]|nr:ATP-binding protein [Oscillospiraceae bacterium]
MLDLCRRLDTLVIFRDLLQDEAIRELSSALRDCVRGRQERFLRRLAAFEARIFEADGDWSRYLFRRISESENVCIRKCGNAPLNAALLGALEKELDFLQCLSALKLDDLPGVPHFMTGWLTSPVDIPGAYRERMRNVGTVGYGLFARYKVFTVSEGELSPVKHPDPQTLGELPGYEREREQIISNTEALLNGQPANNVLLYGDAGTGKSSTVKAIVNEYAGRGLRLVEVKKNQLYELPALMDTLSENPLKFLIFIDDLSFTVNDDNFAALKAILEGSVGGRADNVAVYATSNRRHLIKETFSDREGDDIHASDTRQELMSLSARFGLTVTFGSPDRERYLYIVRKLAERYGVSLGETELSVRAEAFAIRAGGRSARVAKQFVELCRAGVLHS